MARGLIVALVLSVTLNLFAVGFLSGRLITGKDEAPVANVDGDASLKGATRGMGNPFRFMRHAEALPPESRDEFRQAIDEHIPTLRDQHHKVKLLRQAYADAVSAPVWDRSAIEVALIKMQQAQDDQRTLMNDIFLDAFEKLNADERKLLMEQAAKRDHKRGRDGHDRREGRDGGRDGHDARHPEGPPPPPMPEEE